jgi:hypothetical protein
MLIFARFMDSFLNSRVKIEYALAYHFHVRCRWSVNWPTPPTSPVFPIFLRTIEILLMNQSPSIKVKPGRQHLIITEARPSRPHCSGQDAHAPDFKKHETLL